jgi:hypothetical protein
LHFANHKIVAAKEGHKMKSKALALAVALSVFPAAVLPASLDEKLEILQKELDELKAEIARLKGEKAGQASTPVTAGSNNTAAGSQAASAGATTIGGYGELHYNNFRDSAVNDQLDFHRFVLFLGHRFNDRLRLHSELEVEHALVEGGEDKGEVELEQAFVDYRFNDRANLKAGLFLMPIGILNETHEPTTFFGVERNNIEDRIIPTTWREAGFGVYGKISEGLGYDVGMVSSFNIDEFGSTQKPLRSLRQQASRANATDIALYGALNYRKPGLTIGASVFSGNSTQNDDAFGNANGRITLWDAHAQYSIGKLDLRALYARGRIGDAGRLSTALSAKVPNSFDGWLVEAGYHAWQKGDLDVAPFLRYENFDTQKSLPNGLARDANTKDRVLTYGVNFKVHPQVVFKADYQDFKNNNSADSFNLGVGYQF